MRPVLFALATLVGAAVAVPASLSSGTYEKETRSIDEIYQAALAEGGVVTCWHGGDEKNRQALLKQTFEARFPKMVLNITVDLSKYHDGNLDKQIAAGNVYVDSIILQTLQDYPRWKKEGALLNYAPIEFDRIYPTFRDKDAAYTGLFITAWTISVNTNKTQNIPTSFKDMIKPEFKDKLVLTYPNDDDAVLYTFHLLVNDPEFGWPWFQALLANNPRWVRGTATPETLISSPNTTSVATFTTGHTFQPGPGIKFIIPSEGTFTSWDQTGAILKAAPHPEGAKLLHNFMLSDEWQKTKGWSVKQGFPAPPGAKPILEQPNTNAAVFKDFMADRANVERVRFIFEDILGTAQGLSPLNDDL